MKNFSFNVYFSLPFLHNSELVHGAQSGPSQHSHPSLHLSNFFLIGPYTPIVEVNS